MHRGSETLFIKVFNLCSKLKVRARNLQKAQRNLVAFSFYFSSYSKKIVILNRNRKFHIFKRSFKD